MKQSAPHYDLLAEEPKPGVLKRLLPVAVVLVLGTAAYWGAMTFNKSVVGDIDDLSLKQPNSVLSRQTPITDATGSELMVPEQPIEVVSPDFQLSIEAPTRPRPRSAGRQTVAAPPSNKPDDFDATPVRNTLPDSGTLTEAPPALETRNLPSHSGTVPPPQNLESVNAATGQGIDPPSADSPAVSR